jgi:rhamnosyltransferase
MEATASGCERIMERLLAEMPPPVLTIVLSSYNGATFLAAQVDSIRRQTFTDWSLLIRDDGSSDGTVSLVQSLAELEPRLTPVHDRLGNLGPAGSFGVLLEHAARTGSPYVALADQDDVWLPDKLERELDLLRGREREVGDRVPLLVYSDMAVVREDLSVIHPSFLRYQRVHHVDEWPLGTLLIQNFVAGCTIVVNRALLELALPIPKAVVMHDWWLGQCAAALGQVLYLPAVTMLYRQHGGNVLGSRDARSALLDSLRSPISWWRNAGVQLGRTLEQAQELARRLESVAAKTPGRAQSLEAVHAFCAAFESGSRLNRVSALHRHRIRPLTILPIPVRFYFRAAFWSRRISPAGSANPAGVSPR